MHRFWYCPTHTNILDFLLPCRTAIVHWAQVLSRMSLVILICQSCAKIICAVIDCLATAPYIYHLAVVFLSISNDVKADWCTLHSRQYGRLFTIQDRVHTPGGHDVLHTALDGCPAEISKYRNEHGPDFQRGVMIVVSKVLYWLLLWKAGLTQLEGTGLLISAFF